MTRLLLSRKAGSDKIDKTGSPRVQLLDTTYNLQQRKKHWINLSNHFSLWFLFGFSSINTMCLYVSSAVWIWVSTEAGVEYTVISDHAAPLKREGWLSWQQGRWRHNNVWLHVGKEMPSKLFSSPIPSGTGAESDAAENLGEINARNVVFIQTHFSSSAWSFLVRTGLTSKFVLKRLQLANHLMYSTR